MEGEGRERNGRTQDFAGSTNARHRRGAPGGSESDCACWDGVTAVGPSPRRLSLARIEESCTLVGERKRERRRGGLYLPDDGSAPIDSLLNGTAAKQM